MIDDFVEWIDKTHNNVDDLQHRVHALETGERVAIDRVNNIVGRVIKLEELNKECFVKPVDTIEKRFQMLETRLCELEEWTRNDEDIVHGRIAQLEKFKDKMDHVYKVDEKIKSRSCLACDGKGEIWE